MTKEQIEQLALEAYPIEPFFDGDELVDSDTNHKIRKGFIKGLQKAVELLYTEQDLKKMYYKGHQSGLGSDCSMTFEQVLPSLK